MNYGLRDRQDSIPVVLPLLLATGTLSLLAIAWRQRTAPRNERQLDTPAPSRRLRRTRRHLETGADTQPASEGSGALVHRRYEIELPDRAVTRDIVLRLMQLHLTELAPAALANFEKSEGTDEVFRIGDEYEITMLGPWNGRVRVAEMTRDSFTLVTLAGHPEAGHITFSVQEDARSHGNLLVRIESWARSRDALVAAAYGALRIGRQVQTEVWITFLQRLAVLAGVQTRPEVSITTESLPEPTADVAHDG
ncbi:MAG: DUF1990 family protein [Gemmatimonadota bacterium]